MNKPFKQDWRYAQANREALLGVTIPEKAGSFRQLVQAISSRNITELCTRFADPVNAHVLVGIDIKNSDEVASVLDDLRAAGFSACDLTAMPPRCTTNA